MAILASSSRRPPETPRPALPLSWLQSWRTLTGIAVGITLVLSATGCTGDSEQPAPPAGVPSAAEGSGREGLEPLVAPMKVAALRWARGNVPRAVPDPDDPLPSLLADPPGRAIVASYVPRDSYGLADEAIEFYGLDGHWRRLDLGDLDLPANGWQGGDTYGAGSLSPNGRWWAGSMENAMVLLDLRDGSTDVLQVNRRPRGHASFRWAPDGDERVLILNGVSIRVSAPGLTPAPFPPRKGNPQLRADRYPWLRADGSWVDCPESRRRVVTACTTYGLDGKTLETRDVPADITRSSWHPRDEVANAVFYSMPHGPYGNRRHDWELLRTALDFQATARLILPARSEIDGLQGAFDSNIFQLAAIGSDQTWERPGLLLAWLVNQREIVKLLQPGPIAPNSGMDWWDVAFANDLVHIR